MASAAETTWAGFIFLAIVLGVWSRRNAGASGSTAASSID
jgi:hypothetical protein